MGITLRKTTRFSLLVAFILIICSVQSVRAYQNAEHGFSINFPSGWEQTQSQDVVVLYATADGSASMNVIVEDTGLSLADYVGESKDQLEGLDYYELISEDSRTIHGLNGYELVYAWTYFYNDTDYVDLQDKQVFFVENGKAYIITCGADYIDYDLYLSTFEQSLESFRLTSNETPTPAPGTIDTNLVIGVGVVAVIIVLVLAVVVLLRRKRQPAQPQFGSAVTTYPPPPPPPPTS